MAEMEPKIFTLEEANALIPKLSSLMERMQRMFRELRELVASAGNMELTEQIRARQDDPQVRALLAGIQEIIAEIEGYGCHFKGIDLGLVDFPAIHDGEVVYYCWQHGEHEIAWWHTLHEGFGGRHPLEAGAERPRNLN